VIRDEILAQRRSDGGPDPEMLLQMTRATGQALSRVAHMHVLSIADEIARVTRSRELSNSEAADRIAALAESLVRGYEPFLGYIWRRHLFAAISQVVASAAGQVGEAEATTVGFADLVGFTAITQQLSDHELAEVVDHFEKIAYQEIAEGGGRVVKTLGDEVMFSNSNPSAAGKTGLAIAAACKADPVLPDVRVGLAIGSMLAWEGDFYGPTVNLASRLAGIATPGTVIISDELAERLTGDEAFTLIEIRGVKLKGIGKTRPWVLRQREPEKSKPGGR
jgi:adenylate cyclase